MFKPEVSSTNQKWPVSATEAVSEKRLALVLGDGVSVQAGLPDSMRLWLAILGRANGMTGGPTGIPDGRIQALSDALVRDGPFSTMGAIIDQLGRSAVIDGLRAELGACARSTGELHAALARLECQVIIDMTWDDVVPSVWAGMGAGIYTPNRFDGLQEALRQGKPCVLKPMGHLADASSISLTYCELRRVLDQTPEFKSVLASTFSSHQLLFLGMSPLALSECPMSMPIHRKRSRGEPICVVSRWELAEPWRTRMESEYGMRVITYASSTGFPDLLTLIESLQQGVARHKASKRPASGRLMCLFEYLQVNLGESWVLFV